MTNKNFNIIVKNLLKKRGKVIQRGDIYEIVDPEKREKNISSLDKYISQLCAQKIIHPLRNGVYVVLGEEDMNLDSIHIGEKYYYALLKKLLQAEVGSEYYIGGVKALEFYLKDYSIPQKITVMNKEKQKKIFIGDSFIQLKKSQSQKSQSLYPKFRKYTHIFECEGVKLRIADIELALLEASLVSTQEEGIPIDLLSKILKKYGKNMQKERFYELAQYKFAMSCNRLKELSRIISPELSQVFLDIIKKNGGSFIGEGLRGL